MNGTHFSRMPTRFSVPSNSQPICPENSDLSEASSWLMSHFQQMTNPTTFERPSKEFLALFIQQTTRVAGGVAHAEQDPSGLERYSEDNEVSVGSRQRYDPRDRLRRALR